MAWTLLSGAAQRAPASSLDAHQERHGSSWSSPTAQRIRSRQAHRVCREGRDVAARCCGSLAQRTA